MDAPYCTTNACTATNARLHGREGYHVRLRFNSYDALAQATICVSFAAPQPYP